MNLNTISLPTKARPTKLKKRKEKPWCWFAEVAPGLGVVGVYFGLSIDIHVFVHPLSLSLVHFFCSFHGSFSFYSILTMMSTIDLCYLLLILEDHWILKKLGSIEHSLVLIEPLLPSKEAHSKHTHTHTHTHKLLKWPLETSTWNKFKNHFGEMDGTKFKTISWLSWEQWESAMGS